MPRQQFVMTFDYRKNQGNYLVKKNIRRMLKIQFLYPTHKNMRMKTMKKRTLTMLFCTKTTVTEVEGQKVTPKNSNI